MSEEIIGQVQGQAEALEIHQDTGRGAVAVVGAHGKIGQLLSRELSARGYRVLGVHRKPEQAEAVEATGAVSVLHDLESGTAEQLASALRSAAQGDIEAIVFTAGAGPGSGAARKATVDLGGAAQSIEAASRAGVARFVQVSFIGADDDAEPTGEESWDAYRTAKKEADALLRASSLDWTIVRPGHLTDEPPSALVTIGEGLESGETSRGNVALVIATVIAEPSTIHRAIDVLDGEIPVAEAFPLPVRPTGLSGRKGPSA